MSDTEPLSEFKARFPQHGLATDDLSFGVRMLPAALAIKRAIVQYNARHSISWLVYDLDRKSAAWDWEYLDAPPPNIIARNPENGHCHFFYGLHTPVHDYYGASEKALRYMASVDVALTDLLAADTGYSKLLSKNPVNDNWETLFPEDTLYTLDRLAAFLDLRKYRDRRRSLPPVGLGRNCTLFERLRRWAYKERRQPYLSEEIFHEAVRSQALAINTEFSPPLPHNEVRSTAKSVTHWTWRRMSREGFIAYQRRMSRKAAQKRSEKATELRERIVQARTECPDLTQEDLAAMLDVNQSTVARHLKAAGYAAPISDKHSVSGSSGLRGNTEEEF